MKKIGKYEVTDIQYEMWNMHIGGFEDRKITELITCIQTVNEQGKIDGIQVFKDGTVHFMMDGYKHSTTGPALIGVYGYARYFINGYQLDRVSWELVKDVWQYTRYSNLPNANYLDKIGEDDIISASKTWLWTHPNRNSILEEITQRIVNDTFETSLTRLLDGHTQEEFLQWLDDKSYHTSEWVNGCSRLGLKVTRAQALMIDRQSSLLEHKSKEVRPDGTVIVDGSHYFLPDGTYEHRFGTRINIDVECNPSRITADGMSYHIYGKEVPYQLALLVCKFGLSGYGLCGIDISPSAVYQIKEDEVTMFMQCITPELLRKAEGLSLVFFGNAEFAGKILQLVPAPTIHQLFELEDESDIITVLERYIEPTVHSTPVGAMAVAALLGGVAAKALSSKKEKSVTEASR